MFLNFIIDYVLLFKKKKKQQKEKENPCDYTLVFVYLPT